MRVCGTFSSNTGTTCDDLFDAARDEFDRVDKRFFANDGGRDKLVRLVLVTSRGRAWWLWVDVGGVVCAVAAPGVAGPASDPASTAMFTPGINSLFLHKPRGWMSRSGCNDSDRDPNLASSFSSKDASEQLERLMYLMAKGMWVYRPLVSISELTARRQGLRLASDKKE
jgi:hypothetical protein